MRVIDNLIGRRNASRFSGTKKNLSVCCAAVFSLLAVSLAGLVLRAQNPDTMMPAQSAAKAKEIIQQMIHGLGGAAYLNARDQDCTGRISSFGHNSELTGFSYIHELWRFPDSRRIDYSKQGDVVDIYSGNQGWTLDKGGVHDLPDDVVANFREGLKRSVNYLLRYRMTHDQSLNYRYAGGDVIDLKEVDWVEVTDGEQNTLRIAIDRHTHLPVRSSVTLRDPETRDRIEEVTFYSNWHFINGYQIPFQTAREQNGRKIYQFFVSECKANPELNDDVFTRASLDKRWAQLGKKPK